MSPLRAASFKRPRGTAAFTLVEMIVACVVAVFVLFAGSTALLMVLARAAQQQQDALLESANQRAVAQMSKSLKEAKRVLIYNDVSEVEGGSAPVISGNALAIQNADDTISMWAFEGGAINYYHKWFGVDPQATEFSRYQVTMVTGARAGFGGVRGFRRVAFSLADGIPQARWSTTTRRGEVLEGRVTSALNRMR